MKAEYVDHMGDDLRVVNAARVSFDKESYPEVVPGFCEGDCEIVCDEYEVSCYRCDRDLPLQLRAEDKRLISYLASHGHWTPFAHPQITMRETVPIFVARQRFKHMVGFTYNEVSRRYVDDEPEFFTPDVWRSRPDGSVKQGSGEGSVEWIGVVMGGEVISDMVTPISRSVANLNIHALDTYKAMLDAGVAPEQARMVLPQSMFTSYYVTGSLAAWARAYKQRSDAHAQKEIQDLAKDWDRVIRPLFPVSWEALTR